MLIVGTGQSGGQIAEELLAVGREIHLAVSTCPEAPRRYRGQDLLYWMMQLAQFGPDSGLNGLTVRQVPSPRRGSPATRWCPAATAATTSTCGTSAGAASVARPFGSGQRRRPRLQ